MCRGPGICLKGLHCRRYSCARRGAGIATAERWRPVTVPLHPRKEPMRFDPEEMVASARAADQQETQKEMHSSEDDHRRIA